MYEYLDRRYALALYEVAEKKNKVKEYLDDIEYIVNLMKENEDFYKVMKFPQVSTFSKKQMMTRIFKGKVDEELLTFLLILIEKDRILYLEEKLIEMKRIHLDRINTVSVEVKTVIPLEEKQREELKVKLKKMYNKEIIFNEIIDKSIIGGVYVRVGDDVIDQTIKSKLEEMKKLMLK